MRTPSSDRRHPTCPPSGGGEKTRENRPEAHERAPKRAPRRPRKAPARPKTPPRRRTKARRCSPREVI
eukprot:8255354-Pyramimonas_sp.AAC.1